MAPATSLSLMDLRAQIVENCQFFSRSDATISLVIAKEPLGSFKAIVLRAEAGIRGALLSETAPFVYDAVLALHVKSAEAVQNYIANNGFAPVPSVKSRFKQGGSHEDEGNSDAASVSSTVTVDDCESLSDNETVSVTSVCRTKHQNHRKAGRSTKRRSRQPRSPSPFSRSVESESEDDFDFERARGIPPLPIRRPPFFNGFSPGTIRPGGYAPHPRLQHNKHRSFPALSSMGTTPAPAPPFPSATPSSSTSTSPATNPPPSYHLLGMGHAGANTVTSLPPQPPKPPAAAPVPAAVPVMATAPMPTLPPHFNPNPTITNPQQPHLIDTILLIHWRRPRDHHHHHNNNNNNSSSSSNALSTHRAALQQLPSPLTVRRLQDAALAYVRRQPEHHKDMLLLHLHTKNNSTWQLRAVVKKLVVSSGGGGGAGGGEEEYDLSGYGGGADLTRLVAAGKGKGNGELPRVEVEVFGCESPAQAVGAMGMSPPPAAGSGARSGSGSSGSGPRSGITRQAGGMFPSGRGAPPPPPSGVVGMRMGVGAGVSGVSKLPAPAVGRHHAHQTGSRHPHDQRQDC
ncbi:hypothetical protein MFIFM68171_10316 [Madurella fahalii]|uniref:Uncharacterized protein n=1 Tax=Madurella fahalii TaxID=1157608 RepID=A0ABQ0GQU6_9PEZI